MKQLFMLIGIAVFIGVVTGILSLLFKRFLPTWDASWYCGWVGGTMFMLLRGYVKD